MKRRAAIAALVALIYIAGAMSVTTLLPRRPGELAIAPTRTPLPTFTATATATQTLTPSTTPTATTAPTSTATPAPTDTPPPTESPLPTATATPTDTPTPTATTRPAQTPTRPANKPRPQPTSTPRPPFTGTLVTGHTHCGGYAGVTGTVSHENGAPYPGVVIGVWSDAWDGRVALSEESGKYDLPLNDLSPGTFYAAAVRLETCSQQGGLWTAARCERLSNVVADIVVTAHCQGEGANQVTEIRFVGR